VSRFQTLNQRVNTGLYEFLIVFGFCLFPSITFLIPCSAGSAVFVFHLSGSETKTVTGGHGENAA
jgi:hypothetical protein